MTVNIFKKNVTKSFIALAVVLILCGVVFAPPIFAEGQSDAAVNADAKKVMWACISAAIAFAIGAISAGYAISHVGTAAMGALAEKPEIGSQALIFIALAEGLVVFGFITALMILGKI